MHRLALIALSSVALAAAGCSNPQPPGSGAAGATGATGGGSTGSGSTAGGATGSTGASSTGSSGCAGGCPSGQVCSGGACTPIPSACPCPAETYCDLASNTCKAGCVADADCATHRICDSDTRTCHDGCRQDTDCGSGSICQSLTCAVGCRQDSDCGSGEICHASACVERCQTAGCPLDSYCTPEGACEAGCGGAGQAAGMTSRCQVGEACVPYDSYARWDCAQSCLGWTCNGSSAQPFTCFFPDGGDIHGAQCRETCSADADCPSGQVCSFFAGAPGDTRSTSRRFCSTPCTSNADCADAVDWTGRTGEGCTCDPDGLCSLPQGDVCFQVDPGALLPPLNP